jgi:type I restriction enzyme M protein
MVRPNGSVSTPGPGTDLTTQRGRRALSSERFLMPEGCDFDTLYTGRDKPDVGNLFNIALEKIEDFNQAKLNNVFCIIDFNSEPVFGLTKERIGA